MDAKELDSFVLKFKQLWRSGQSAHLDIDTCAGQAWVGLRVRLGQAQAVPSSLRRTRDGPARQRRRARRADAKEKEVEEASNNEVEGQQDAENAGEDLLDNSEKEGEAGQASNSENAVDDDPTEEVVEIVEEDPAVATSVTVGYQDEGEPATVSMDSVTTEITVSEPEPIVVDQPEEVTVFVNAVIENSANDALTQADLKSLESLIFRENHLRENILKLEFGQHSTREFRNHGFKHILDLKILVNTRKLWDAPRTYIWKHFGRDEWRKENGSKVTFSRIHVKN